MGIKRRQYISEQKEEIVRSLLSSQTVLELGRESIISPRSDQSLEKTAPGMGAQSG